MSHRRGKLDMAHALAAHARQGHFHAALLADDALVLHALVLAAKTLVVLDRPEDARTEKAVTLRLAGAVVDRLRLLDLAERPGKDLFRGRKRHAARIEHLGRRLRTEEVHDLLVPAIILVGCSITPLNVVCGRWPARNPGSRGQAAAEDRLTRRRRAIAAAPGRSGSFPVRH